MLDIKGIKKLYSEDIAKNISDFASLKQAICVEVENLRKNGTLKDTAMEIKGEMEWLKARNRLSEISLSLAIVSVVLSIITALLSWNAEQSGEGYLNVCVWVMTILAVVSGSISICTFRAHKRECNLLAYYTIKLELIQAEIDKKCEKAPEKDERNQKTIIQTKVVKCKMCNRRCCCHKK